MSRSVNRGRMSASKLVSFAIAHRLLLNLFQRSGTRAPRNSRAAFLCPRFASSASHENAARESENLKDAVDGTVGHSVTCIDREDPVHPIVLRGAGLEHGT